MKIDIWEVITLTFTHESQNITTIINSLIILKVKFKVCLLCGLYTEKIIGMIEGSLSSFWSISTLLSIVISKLLKHSTHRVFEQVGFLPDLVS